MEALMERVLGVGSSVRALIVSLWAGFILGVKYVWADAKKSKKNTLIGIFTIVLVLSCVCLLQNAISKSPMIFMKIAENEVGEFDLLLTPKVSEASNEVPVGIEDPYSLADYDYFDEQSTSSNPIQYGLNQTDIQQRIEGHPSILGSAPRWTMLGRVFNALNHTHNGTIIILVIDSKQEEKAQIGRNWNRRPLGYEETYISNSALRQIGVQPAMGERVHIGFDFLQLATTFAGLDEETVADLLSAFVQNLVRNKTITVNEERVLRILGLTGPNRPIFLPPANETGDVTINLDNISPEAIDSAVHQYVNDNWDEITARLSPDQMYIECTVVDGVDDPAGKWPKSLGNVAVLESSHLLRSVEDIIPDNPILQDMLATVLGLKDVDDPELYNIKEHIEEIDINAYALMVIVQYAGRFDAYIKETTGMEADMIEFTNNVAEALGVYYPAEFQLPIQEILVGLNYLRTFLDQIFNSVLVILVGMGVMLIYSLLLSDVEDKTYEYGMLRALGLPHNSLIELLLIQAIFYALPGIVLGLSIAFLLGIPVTYIMAQYASVTPNYWLSDSTLVLGLTLGILMPMISNIVPIKRALSRTLRDSLDVYHQTSQQVNVQMIKLESLGLDPWQLVSALMMVSVGFLIYYVVPLSFIFLRISVFLTILNGILLGMLIGATIIATLFQPILERQVLKLLLWGRDTTLETLITKSLAGHRSRNRKTALMYSICLAFIIFSGAMFTLQTNAIIDNVKAGIGSDIVIIAATTNTPLQEDSMREFLELQLKRVESERVLIAYSFLTYPMWATSDVRGNYVSNLAGFPWHQLNVYGLDKDFLNSVYGEYFLPSEVVDEFNYNGVYDDASKPDIVRSLYTDAGNQTLPIEEIGLPKVIVSSRSKGVSESDVAGINEDIRKRYSLYIDAICSEALRYGSHIDTSSPVKMEISAHSHHYSFNMKYMVKLRAMVTKMSGFFFSSYRELAISSPLLLSMDQYQSILDDVYSVTREIYLNKGYSDEEITDMMGDTVATPPKQRVFIKIKPGATLNDRELIMNGLRNFIEDSTTVVLDTTDLLETTDVATFILLLFFDIVAIISSAMSFFVLWISFTSNIKENSWEFGVLRAIGLSAAQVTRVYIYEALCIIISALILGSATGLGIAVTLTLQFNLFTEMPFHFDFPYFLFASVMIMSITVAIGGSYLASRDIKKKQIAQVLKGSL